MSSAITSVTAMTKAILKCITTAQQAKLNSLLVRSSWSISLIRIEN
jgi:hypothetical protein